MLGSFTFTSKSKNTLIYKLFWVIFGRCWAYLYILLLSLTFALVLTGQVQCLQYPWPYNYGQELTDQFNALIQCWQTSNNSHVLLTIRNVWITDDVCYRDFYTLTCQHSAVCINKVIWVCTRHWVPTWKDNWQKWFINSCFVNRLICICAYGARLI